MRFRLGHLGKLFKDAFKAWNAKDPFRQSAIIAYYAVFSLPALLVLIITFAGFFFGAEAVNREVLSQVADTMGKQTAAQVKEMLIQANTSKSSIWATIIGVVVLISGALGVFLELQTSLNIIWEVKAEPKKGIWSFLRARIFSFGLILAIAFLLLVSLVISTALAAISNWLRADSTVFATYMFQGIDFLVSLCIIALLFALIFKVLPDVKVSWRNVLVGSLVTGILFIIGKTALAFYFGKANPASGYGAAGSIILILLWFSYSSMILFYGAEFTRVFAKKYEGTVKPVEFAKKEPPHTDSHAA